MAGPFGIAFDALPGAISIFPLPGALLLPGGRLPLNIFEPRYLAMIFDALGDSRLIGMVQTEAEHGGLVPEDAPLFGIGCAGRIVAFNETRDGRLMITLEGVCRYRIDAELGDKNGYRRVRPDFSAFRADMDERPAGLDRDGFLEVLRRYFDAKQLKVDWASLEQTEDRLLIANLAMMCPFGLPEKQALLEAPDFAAITSVMEQLMTMAIQEAGPSTATH
ncbi:MAG: peptidase S16 [Rhodospirillaceae bacterium]|nr:peptidase S16 [Rhodospirillaceae bacterium]MBT5841757.1 peptidase S16 [Rhodospirillaceae bacterium]